MSVCILCPLYLSAGLMLHCGELQAYDKAHHICRCEVQAPKSAMTRHEPLYSGSRYAADTT